MQKNLRIFACLLGLLSQTVSATVLNEIGAVNEISTYSRQAVYSLSGESVTKITLHPLERHQALITTSQGMLMAFNLCRGNVEWSVRAHRIPNYTPEMRLSPSGRYIVTAEPARWVAVYDSLTGNQLTRLQLPRVNGHPRPNVSFGFDDSTFFASNNRKFHQISLSSGEVVSELDGLPWPARVASLHVLSSGDVVGLANDQGLLRWTDNALQPSINPVPAGVDSNFTGDLVGDRYITMQTDHPSRVPALIDSTDSTRLQRFIGHTNDWTIDIAVSGDLRTTFTAAYDGTIRIWETRTGRLLTTMASSTSLNDRAWVGALTSDQTGRLLVVGINHRSDEIQIFGRDIDAYTDFCR